MRQPIASKLSELRAAIVEIEQRKSFTKKQRQQVYTMFDGLCSCGCEEPLDGEKWEIDHVIPLALGGAHEPGNWAPRIKAHHVEKSREDIKRIAKARRIVKRETEGPKPSRFQNRPFPKDLRKKMNGQVVRREKTA